MAPHSRSEANGKPKRKEAAPSVNGRQDDDDDSVSVATGKAVRLTSEDRHYLNKALACLQMQQEWSALSQIGELTMYGYPYLDHPAFPKQAGGWFRAKQQDDAETTDWEKPISSPILSYLFKRYIYGFPGLSEAKRGFWTDRIQPFFDGFARRNLSSTRERSEVTKRRVLSMGFTRFLSTYYVLGITPRGAEDGARPSRSTMREVDGLFPGRMETMTKAALGVDGRPSKLDGQQAWVAVPQLEDDEYTFVTQLPGTSSERVFARRSRKELRHFLKELDRLDTELAMPVLTSADLSDRLAAQRLVRQVVISLFVPTKAAVGSNALDQARELTRAFLLDAAHKLSKDEQAKLTDQADKDDQKLEDDRKRWMKVGKHIRNAREAWGAWVDGLIDGDELDRSWNLIAEHDSIKKLPHSYWEAEQWAKIWVAYILNFLLVESSTADDLLSLLAKIHKLIPYELMKQGLRIVNPAIAIKVIVNIIFGQLLGQPSFFQRLFGIIAGGDIKARTKDIARLRAELGDQQIADALVQYVYAPREHQETTREQSHKDGEDILLTILRRSDLPDDHVETVEGWRRSFLQGGADGSKFLLAKELLRDICLKRDREQILEIVNEPNSPRIILDAVDIFYTIIYKIAEASNLARALGDLQKFITDLLDCLYKPESENKMVGLLKVIDKHEPSLWLFGHELASHIDLSDPFREWARDGLAFLKHGIPPEGSKKRRFGVDLPKLLESADGSTGAEALEEVRAVADWMRHRKALTDLRYRVDFLAKDGDEHDLAALAEELIARHKGMSTFREVYSGAKGEKREEDVVGWAWWADAEVLDNPGDVQVDWVAKKKRAKAEKKKKKKRGQQPAAADGVEEFSNRFLPTPPRLNATRRFLDAYSQQISGPLDAARPPNRA